MAFRCNRCGFCCQLEVALNDKDIIRLKNAGFGQFTHKSQGEMFLKHRGKYCMFYNEGCSIYSIRPAVCQRFPFKDGRFSPKCTQRKDFYAEIDRKISKFLINNEIPGRTHLFKK